jgi:hypothetical protein
MYAYLLYINVSFVHQAIHLQSSKNNFANFFPGFLVFGRHTKRKGIVRATAHANRLTPTDSRQPTQTEAK